MLIPAFFLATLLDLMWVDSVWWTVLGFAAQGLFSARFLVQWLASEKERRVVVPVYFWYFSIAGGWLNLLYAGHLWKAPLIAGAIASLITSHRNLQLHNAGKDREIDVSES
ncbi:MAG TPA: lipid-A-disaccharide synthase N-terminal domain-containing protein [Chthoniobacteraceae bacterium]|nr:lipid-A-disaccharide synthase N-terminal domain-containing protein [Chthoniobacteraceae bacterium]